MGGEDERGARVRGIDAVRGLVMIVMALDHVRDFIGGAHHDATDLARTTVPVFATRWITHFCAPTFFLLAGVSAWLSIRSGRRTRGQAARFLIVRGLALIAVEQTLLRCLGWYFHFDYQFMNAGVLWGLGWSMVLLAGLVWMPAVVSVVVGSAVILLEGVIAGGELGGGPVATLVALATQSRDFEPVAGYHFYVSYPPIPWFGAMAFGYGLAASIYEGREGRERRWLIAAGAGFVVMFAIGRALGVGDPSPYAAQSSGVFSALSFVNVSKYSPSTAFMLLTLGGALLALAWFARRPAPWLERFGRVPLFFYLIHVPLIHAIAVGYSYVAFGEAWWLTSGPVVFWDKPLPGSPPEYGLPLAGVYAVWIAVVVMLAPVCGWYGRRREARPLIAWPGRPVQRGPKS